MCVTRDLHESRNKLLSLQPMPYQGSKRKIASQILNFFPENQFNRLVEPFAGSAAISLACAASGKFDAYWLNDGYVPLADLWKQILEAPDELVEGYTQLWNAQAADPKLFYNQTRLEFNKDSDPTKFLYLLARAVKNAIRFNSNGEFNQSPDNRRLGRKPTEMRKQILQTSFLLSGKANITSLDYADVLDRVTQGDLVYMDPPYQGTSTKKDSRYFQGLDKERFIKNLKILRSRHIGFVISFDGRLGTKTYGEDLPEWLDLEKIDIHAGRSTQSTLNGGTDETIESLYLSPEIKRMLMVH